MRWIVFLVCIICSAAFAGFHGGAAYAPNNNQAMMEFGTYGYEHGEFPFIDASKMSWWTGNLNSGSDFTASTLNVYGNPTTASNFSSTWNRGFFILSQSSYSSNYVFDWIGTIPPSDASFLSFTVVAINNGPGGSSCANSGGNVSGTNCQVTGTPTAQTVGSSGSPSTFTGDSAWDYVCNTLNLCGNAGPSYTGNPTTTIAGVCPELNGAQTIISATPTTITVNAATDASCTYTSGGTASYVGSGTYIQNFVYAAMQDNQMTPIELANLQAFYASGAVACPTGDTCPSPTPYVPIASTMPAEYEEADGTEFTKLWNNIFTSVKPVFNANVEFNAVP